MASRILLIENNTTDAQVIEQLIHVKEGVNLPDFAITRVENLKSGMERLAEQTFEAVLCDLDLPDAPDIEGFLRVLSSTGTAVIVLTDDLEKREGLENTGVADFLYKGSLENKVLRRSLMYSIARTKYEALNRSLSLDHFLDSPNGDEIENARRNRILLVTDRPEENQLGAQVSDLGYEVIATNPEEAADNALRTPPAIILIEAQESNEGAVAVSQQIRQNRDLMVVPVVIATRNFNTEEVLKAQAAGVNSFIARPIRMGELALLLGNLARLQSRETQLLELTSQWQNARRSLTGYFPGDFVENLLSQKFATEIDGSKINASILRFALSDARPLLNSMEPQAFARLLNRLMGDVMAAVVGTGGSINRLSGDGLLATFGCPRPKPDDATSAVAAARKIRDIMDSFNAIRSPDEGGPVPFGVSVTTGEVFAGCVGSEHRREYTVLGEPVLRADALLAMARKSSQVSVLADAATRDAAGDDENFKRVRAKTENAPVMYLVN